MLTFNNVMLDGLLARSADDARAEADQFEVDPHPDADLQAQAVSLVTGRRVGVPQLCEECIWLDHLEIASAVNPRVELMFHVKTVMPAGFLVNYLPSAEFDVPLAIKGDRWVFTYAVDLGFEPGDVRARFLADLEATGRYLASLRDKEMAWAGSLADELALRLSKRRLRMESVASRVSAIGYPTSDPEGVPSR